jgi:ribosomal-protein-alanine N-acetyltransferase
VIAVRPAAESDLDEIWRIQSASGQAAQWNAADYLAHECVVAVIGDRAPGEESSGMNAHSTEGRIAGFAVARRTAPDEIEILNVAVDPPYRRRGVARSLIQELVVKFPGAVFLEVRQSNSAARKLYHSLGFQVIAVRQNYYDSPDESAIVMKFHSC